MLYHDETLWTKKYNQEFCGLMEAHDISEASEIVGTMLLRFITDIKKNNGIYSEYGTNLQMRPRQA